MVTKPLQCRPTPSVHGNGKTTVLLIVTILKPLMRSPYRRSSYIPPFLSGHDSIETRPILHNFPCSRVLFDPPFRTPSLRLPRLVSIFSFNGSRND